MIRKLCRWMKCSDVVPEAGCHYLLETLTAINFQMAGCMPVIHWKCHSFHMITMYFHHVMQEEVASSSWNDGSWKQAAADQTTHPVHSSQVRANCAGDTAWNTQKSPDNLSGKQFWEPCLENTFLVNSSHFISFHLVAPWFFLIAYLKGEKN